MILLNFSHPLTSSQLQAIATLTGQSLAPILAVMPQFDEQQPFGPQAQALLAQAELSSEQWQGEPILVVLPSLNFIAALLLAALHGRMGYFPTVVRIRPIPNSLPRQFEVAEILDLQATREQARNMR